MMISMIAHGGSGRPPTTLASFCGTWMLVRMWFSR